MLKRLLIVVLFVSVFAGCSTTNPPPQNLRLRVLTYNIHHGEGSDGRFDYPRLAEIINRVQPDLVALQEVDVQTRRSKGVDQAERLGALTGMHAYFAEAMPYQGGRYGEAVLSKIAPAKTIRIPLPAEPGQEPRAGACIRLSQSDPDGLPVYFVGTHLCHLSEQTRINQVRRLIRRPPLAIYPGILAGDFNFTPGSEPYNMLINEGWVDAAQAFGNPKPTVPADQPSMRIDYVFVRPAARWRIVDVQVLDEPVASDHAPVLVVLEYTAP